MSVYLQDPDVTIHQGDVLDELRNMPNESVHMCCTSPPFYGLRDYGTGTWEGGDESCDHEPTSKWIEHNFTANSGIGAHAGTSVGAAARAKWSRNGICPRCGARRVDQQIGLEATPDEYVARLVEVFREVRRVLRSDGSLWLEIGDSYNSQGTQGATSDRSLSGNDSQQFIKHRLTGVKHKDLIGAPWLLAFALRQDGWYLRSEIIWAKPNPMPESVTDRPTTSHSRVFLLTKSARYFYDAEAIREDGTSPNGSRAGYAGYSARAHAMGREASGNEKDGMEAVNNGFRNRRSVWTIATQPYPEAHFATWPVKLVEPMIQAGTSERGVCPECGAPWRRIVERQNESAYARIKREHGITYKDMKAEAEANGITPGNVGGTHAPGQRGAQLDPSDNKTLGWQPGCTHTHEPVPATVLDPFGGSGTTAHVARKLGRRAVLIELNAEYCALAARRLQQQSLFA